MALLNTVNTMNRMTVLYK